MKYNEIVKLLDNGFTPDQIMALVNGQAPAAEQAPEAVPVTDPAAAPPTPEDIAPAVVTEYVESKEPEWARKLNENINSMKNAIYAQNIQQDMSGGEKPETAEDIMLGMIGHHDGGSHA